MIWMCERCARRLLRWPWWRLLLWSGVMGRGLLECPHGSDVSAGRTRTGE